MDKIYHYYHEHSLGKNGKVDQVTVPSLETPRKVQLWRVIVFLIGLMFQRKCKVCFKIRKKTDNRAK